MSGTVEGGRKDAKGGRNGHTGGFASNRELARIAGAKGGRISRRGETKKSLEERRKEALDYISHDKPDTHRGFLSRLLGDRDGKD